MGREILESTGMNGEPEISDLMLFVADTLSDDCESIPLILNMLNFRWGRPRVFMKRDFVLDDVTQALDRLVKHDLVASLPLETAGKRHNEAIEECELSGKVKGQWFRLTPKGRQALDAWLLPKDIEDHITELVRVQL